MTMGRADASRISRWSRAARVVHWTNMLSVLLLIYTGAALYADRANVLAYAVGGFYVTRLVHRIAAVVIVVVPLVLAIGVRGSFSGFLKDVFSWGKDDLAWLVRFPIYFFRPSVKMPAVHGRSTSGQRVLAWIMLTGVTIQVITGSILWFRPFTKGTVMVAWVLHDIGFITIGVALMFHVYVGLGIFRPYRGIAGGMLGGGTVPVKLARHHWPEWADEQLTGGGERE